MLQCYKLTETYPEAGKNLGSLVSGSFIVTNEKVPAGEELPAEYKLLVFAGQFTHARVSCHSGKGISYC